MANQVIQMKTEKEIIDYITKNHNEKGVKNV